jgi:hypothetical protein
MSYITLSELKSQYPSVDYSVYSDATLNSIINSAESKVNEFVEYSFDLENLTNEISKGFIDSDYSLVVFPRKKPILSLSSISIIKGSAEINITLTNGQNEEIYTIPETKDRIIFPIADISLQSVSIIDFGVLKSVDFFTKISYQAGYNTIPDVVKEATMLFALEVISRNMNISGATQVSQGGISISYNSSNGNRLGKEAKSLLMDYKKVSGW